MERTSTNKTEKCGLLLPMPGITSITHLISGQNHERNRQFRVRIHLWLPILLLLFIGRTHALDVEYCSNTNTGSSYSAAFQQYQSHGLCYDNCKASYAFAVIQGFRCWCSDYIPAMTTTGCDEFCPGYDKESCGSTKKGLFGYIALPNQPKGTAGGSTTASPTSEPTTSPTPTTLTTSTTTDSSSSSTPSVTVITSIDGYRTVTLTPSNGPTSSATPSVDAAPSKGSFFSNPGRVAGLFVGLALGVIALVAGLLFFCYRRNQQKGTMDGADPPMNGTIPAGGAGVIPGRRRSRSLSTLGLIGEKAGPASKTSPPSTKPNTLGLSATEVRKSAPVIQPPGRLIDQRLDPNQIYLRYDPDTGSSRMSVRSLRDDTDYSRRVLRLANPDD